MKKFLAVAASAAALTAVAPAEAKVSVIQNRCASLATGCAFSGNITGTTTLATQTAYNSLFGASALSLNWLFKNDDKGLGNTVSFASPTAGSWSTPGFLVDFIAVKASTEFVLYKLATPISSGSWTTAGIVNGKGQTQALSHLAFFGSAAPVNPVVIPGPTPVPVPPVIDPAPVPGPVPPVLGPVVPAPQQPVFTPPQQPTPGAAVPEPAAWALMLAGFGVVGAMARRRKQIVRYA